VQELQDIRGSNLKVFRDIAVDDSNILLWHGLIVPVSMHYIFSWKLHFESFCLVTINIEVNYTPLVSGAEYCEVYICLSVCVCLYVCVSVQGCLFAIATVLNLYHISTTDHSKKFLKTVLIILHKLLE